MLLAIGVEIFHFVTSVHWCFARRFKLLFPSRNVLNFACLEIFAQPCLFPQILYVIDAESERYQFHHREYFMTAWPCTQESRKLLFTCCVEVLLNPLSIL